MSEYVVVIPADTDVRPYAKELVPDDGNGHSTLKFFQEIVGGWIEVVPAHLLNRSRDFSTVSICLNEEGKLTGLPINPRASAWYYPPYDVIVGDVALIGPPDDEGNTTGFTVELAARLVRRVSRI
jgi:hypothetical protein